MKQENKWSEITGNVLDFVFIPCDRCERSKDGNIKLKGNEFICEKCFEKCNKKGAW